MRRPLPIALLAALLAAAPFAAAHVVTVDGDPVDWTMARPTNLNTGHLARNMRLEGEYVWTDAQGDERTDFAAPVPAARAAP